MTHITTVTGYDYALQRAPARCTEIAGDAGTVCRVACTALSATPPAGRPMAHESYCDAHGGEQRARDELARNWMLCASPEVGDEEAVQLAGTLSLQTPDAYVVLRQLTPEQGGKWTAHLGLGTLQIAVSNPAVDLARNKRGNARHPEHARKPRRGQYAFADRDSALRSARGDWAQRVFDRVEEITRARGGTLAWGVTVEPLDEPIVVDLGQSTGSAWDAAVQLPRVSRRGLSAISGLRPSGEAA